MKRHPGPEVERFSFAQRTEHFVLLIIFNVLMLTGLPQKYSTAAWGESLISLLGGIDQTRFVHRTFAILLLLHGLYHLAVVAATRTRQVRRHEMSPGLRDVRDLFVDMSYLAGRTDSRPAFGRFDYRQKFEYWAVLWGTVIFVATGLIMWFPSFVTQWVPGVIVPASRVAHGGEALLALFAVIIWHFYNAHFRPDVFPMDPAMFTGKITLERMHNEHPLEHEHLRLHGLLPSAGEGEVATGDTPTDR